MIGWVKPEERQNGTPIIFWNVSEREIENSKGEKQIKKFAFLKHYTVYNVEQCERLMKKVPTEEKQRVIGWRKLVQQYKQKPKIKNGGNRACYAPLTDEVRMPKLETFDSENSYASVIFHELTHSTGHKSRLDRDGIRNVNFGSKVYSEEELIAEIGAAFLCGKVGILERTIKNSSAYIKSWLRVLKNDRGMILSSATKAQKATDWILGNRKETKRKTEKKNSKKQISKTEETKKKNEKTKSKKTTSKKSTPKKQKSKSKK
jgi:antirestriction protein ArdC